MIIILVMIIIKPCVPIMVVGAAEYNDGRAAAAKSYNLLVMVFPSILSAQKRACHR